MTAKIFVGIGLITVVFWNVDLSEIGMTMGRAGPGALLLALAFFVSSRLLEGIRLYVLAHKLGCSLRVALEIIFVSTFFNNFALTLVGDGYKVVALNSRIKSWQAATIVVVTERLLGIVAIVGIGLTIFLVDSQSLSGFDAAAIEWDRSALQYGAAAGLVLLLVGVAVFLWRRRGIALFVDAVREMVAAGRPWQVALSLILTILAQIALAAMVFSLLLALDAEIRFAENLLVMLVVFVAAFVPITIGSLGVREGAIVIGLGWFGVLAPVALSAALISRGLIYVLAGAAGAWWALRGRTHDVNLRSRS